MFVIPCRSDRKYSARPSLDHCGLMFFTPSNPPASRTSPDATSMTAIRRWPDWRAGSFVVNRSVLKASERPSGDHAGSSSAYASVVSRRSVPAFRS